MGWKKTDVKASGVYNAYGDLYNIIYKLIKLITSEERNMIWREKKPAINYDIKKVESSRATFLGENVAPRISIRMVTIDNQRVEFELPLGLAKKLAQEATAAVKASLEIL